MDESWKRRMVLLALAVATVAVYAEVVRHGFFVLDDDDYVAKNQIVQAGLTARGFTWALTTSAVANWHPLTWMSHMLDYQLFGLRPGWHHMVNVLFHVANTLLLFLLLNRITRGMWQSAFVAAVFALHPLHVESVAWIAERKDVLSTFFGLLTIWAYVACVRKRRLIPYFLMLVCFTLGLMAKPMLVTLPFVLLLLDYWPLNRFDFTRASIRANAFQLVGEKLPLFALSAFSSYITFAVQQKGGAVRSLESIPVWSRLGNIAVSYVHYSVNALFPARLAIYYPHPGKNLAVWQIAGATAILLALTLLFVYLLRKQRYLAVGWLWFLGTLVPVIGLVQVGSQAIADRYMYIPLIGLAIIAAWGIADLVRDRISAKLVAGVAAIVIVAMAAGTVVRVLMWNSDVVLFERALAYTDTNDFSEANLAIGLYRQNDMEGAEEHFKKAVEERKNYTMALVYLGIIKANQAKYDEAASYYQQALEGMPGDPAMFDAHNNLGAVYFAQGKIDDAVKQYRLSVELRPGDGDVHYNLGAALAQQGKRDEAVAEFRLALQARPGHAKAQAALNQIGATPAAAAPSVKIDLPKTAEDCYQLGNSYAQKQKYPEAEAAFQQAVKLRPDFTDAQINLGNSLAVQGKLGDAVAQFQQVIKRLPSNADAHLNLGNVYSEMGKYKEAGEEYTQALRLSSNNANAWFSLGWVQARQGKLEESADSFKRAMAIDPSMTKAKDALVKVQEGLSKK